MEFKKIIKHCNYWQIPVILSFIIAGGILLILSGENDRKNARLLFILGISLLSIGFVLSTFIWFSYTKCKKIRIKWIKG